MKTPPRRPTCLQGDGTMLATRLWTIVGLGLIAPFAQAQLVVDHAPYKLTVEGYANATAGRSQGESNAPDSNRSTGRIDTMAASCCSARASHCESLASRLLPGADREILE